MALNSLVDLTVVKEFFPPHTMMTNLGDLQTAVEFVPSELFGKLPHASFADVVFDEFHGEPKFRAIGILTGNSPEAGILLWRTINSEIRSQPRLHVRGDFDFPRIVIESIPEMGLSMELVARGREVRPVVLSAVRRLCKAGVDVVALACNTTQYYASEIRGICSEYSVEFVSMVETTAARLIREGVEAFDLLATALVSGSGEWSDFAPLREEFDVRIPSERDLAAITELAFSVKREVITTGSINRLRDLIASSTTNETVVVALTELSILLESQRSGQRSRRRYIDTLTVLGETLAARYCAERISFGAA